MIEIKKKTSTAGLIDKKAVKELKRDTRLTEMEKIIGIQKIIDNYIVESLYGFSVILKISTADISLLSDEEMYQLENTLIGYSFGLQGTIKYKRSNRRQSFKKYKQYLEDKFQQSNTNDYMKMYKDKYIEQLTALENKKDNNTKINYIYITVPKNNIRERALKQLQDKVNYIYRALVDANITLDVVEGLEVIEVFYNEFNKLRPVQLDKYIESGVFSDYIEGLGILVSDEVRERKEDILMDIISAADAQRIEEEEAEEKKLIEEEQQLKSGKKVKKKKEKKKKEEPEKLKGQEELVYEYGRYRIYDMIKPEIWKEEEDYIRLGRNQYCRMMIIQSMPKTMNIMTLNELCSIEDMEMTTILRKLDEKRLSSELKDKYSKVMANLILQWKNEGTVDYDQKEVARNLDELRQLIQTNSDKLFNVQIFAKIWAGSLVDLERRTNELEDICAQKGIPVQVVMADQRDAFITCMPVHQFPYIANQRNLTTGGAAVIVPTGSTYLIHPEGKYIGHTIGSNSPIIFDNFLCQKKHYKESQNYSNPHIYVSGITGAGKSTFMKSYIARGSIVCEWYAIFDMENEYIKLCEKFGGNYIHIKTGRKSGINPLELTETEDEKGNITVPLNEKVVEITNFLNDFVAQYRKKGLEGTEIAGVQDGIKAVYANRGITTDQYSLYDIDSNGKMTKKRLPILSDLREEFLKDKNLTEVAELMKLITGDGMMAMFDCETSYKIANFEECSMVVFCLKELDSFTQYFAMTTILSWLWGLYSNIKYKGIQKNVCIDEGWKFAKSKESLNIIEDFSRRGRKYWISLIISTQSIDEFLSTNEGKAIINLCATKYIFKQNAKLAKQICDFFGLPEITYKRLPSFKKGQGILFTETGVYEMQVDMFSCDKDFAQTS